MSTTGSPEPTISYSNTAPSGLCHCLNSCETIGIPPSSVAGRVTRAQCAVRMKYVADRAPDHSSSVSDGACFDDAQHVGEGVDQLLGQCPVSSASSSRRLGVK